MQVQFDPIGNTSLPYKRSIHLGLTRRIKESGVAKSIAPLSYEIRRRSVGFRIKGCDSLWFSPRLRVAEACRALPLNARKNICVRCPSSQRLFNSDQSCVWQIFAGKKLPPGREIGCILVGKGSVSTHLYYLVEDAAKWKNGLRLFRDSPFGVPMLPGESSRGIP